MITSVTNGVLFGAVGGGTLSRLSRSVLKTATVALVAIAATASTAWAETLLMPTRDARAGTPVVVWGMTTQPAATVCALDFGDLSPIQSCTGVADTYIAYPHNYATQGTYTVTLTVGIETTTTTIQIFNTALLTPDNNRSLGINMAIQDGLRYLYQSQSNLGSPTAATTSWNNSGFPYADTSLVTLAFENQGYKLVANVLPTGVYEKYVVRRGLNYVLSNLNAVTLTLQTAGDPCAVYGPAPCQGYAPPGDTGYTTALAILSIAGSGAMGQINTEAAGPAAAPLTGKTYGEILQRLLNSLAFGQNDGTGAAEGGWDYNFNNASRADGSTIGWDVLAILDARSAGATVPAFMVTEFAKLLKPTGGGGMLNSDGSFDYVANGALSNNSVGPQKNGIGLQALFLADPPPPTPGYPIYPTTPGQLTAVTANIASWWPGAVPSNIGGNSWGGCPGNSNHGCAYTMFNNFKGLKLQGIATLPTVNRPTYAWYFPGTTGANNDWYADYQDWLVANQSSPTTITGGTWGPNMGFSCCASGDYLETAIAELILSPVALVAPDPILFSTVGLSPVTATNPVGTNHTVTAFAQAANNAPVPGVTIDFRVLSGPNAGKTGTGTTGADGKTTFTYADTGGAGTDTIQAFIGTTLSSNQVVKIWGLACDINGDGKVSPADLRLIQAKLNTVASGPTDPLDPNRDGVINVADMRYCQLRMTATTP